jgi:hypothetical protein
MPNSKPDPFRTIKVRDSTKRELIKAQGLYQVQHGEKLSMDELIKGLLESQPKVDLKGRITENK